MVHYCLKDLGLDSFNCVYLSIKLEEYPIQGGYYSGKPGESFKLQNPEVKK